MKYTIDLHEQICINLGLTKEYDISTASNIAMIERKNHTRNKKPMEKAKGSHPKAQEILGLVKLLPQNEMIFFMKIIKLWVTLEKSVRKVHWKLF